jgi:hypothetical protein
MDSNMKKEMENSVFDQMIELLMQTAEKEGSAVEQSEVHSELKKIKSVFENDETV